MKDKTEFKCPLSGKKPALVDCIKVCKKPCKEMKEVSKYIVQR